MAEIKGSTLNFTQIYQDNSWGDSESRSGHGSNMTQTAHIRAALPSLFTELGIQSILDIPCGDFHWMQHVTSQSGANMQYIGGDIVEELIASNQKAFGGGHIDFRVLNVVSSDLPRVDLVFVRDCFVHLPLAEVFKALDNIKRSGAKYLLTTTFPGHPVNNDEFLLGMWRTLNLERPPFGFPSPLKVINERCTEAFLGDSFTDKSLALWPLEDL
ncbi:hypothetical protein UA08_07586 [Talaromyces atroroseus]|uniref:Methyltransferase domain-containing protein n=1 Tax=Talaromyces atroroseus TaxID=1441469 RepID=A0A225AAR7_TALAT|nr:hypothetical protein UA08_07586 [Talaromyces atroroseus]OKL57270.1 hypothetical protein UA08_07586 [Talaromyces atroroseus]